MKLKKPELWVIALTAGLIFFAAGYFAGRATATPDGGIAVITQRQPTPPEVLPVAPEEPAPAETSAEGDEKIDINTADAVALATLPGIGETLAQRIVAYREATGPFFQIEDLAEVEGIGEKKLEGLWDFVCVGGSKR